MQKQQLEDMALENKLLLQVVFQLVTLLRFQFTHVVTLLRIQFTRTSSTGSFPQVFKR
jgi:hypothetical protein